MSQIPQFGGRLENNNQQVAIVEGTIGFDDQGALFQNTQDDSVWNDYMVVNRYEYDPHRYMAGVTSPNGFGGAKAAFFQLTTPTFLWVADWTAYKSNDTPEIPDPTPADPNWVFLGMYPAESAMLTVAADGVTGRFRLSGTYVYGHQNPPTNPWDEVVFGRPPWLQPGLLSRRIKRDKLTQGIINDQGEGSGQSQLRTNPGLGGFGGRVL